MRVNPKQTDPLLAAADILETESNTLAYLIDDKAFKDMPPRVALAVHYEMTRLRDIATELKNLSALPVTKEN